MVELVWRLRVYGRNDRCTGHRAGKNDRSVNDVLSQRVEGAFQCVDRWAGSVWWQRADADQRYDRNHQATHD